MTVGRRVDIAGIGPRPPNARVEAWWPQRDVLANSSVVLGHGGFGTTMGAMQAGVPQVVAPIFTSDQVVNGRYVAAVGAGRATGVGPDAVGWACGQVLTVLTDPAYRARAESIAASIATLPQTADAVAVLQGIGR